CALASLASAHCYFRYGIFHVRETPRHDGGLAFSFVERACTISRSLDSSLDSSLDRRARTVSGHVTSVRWRFHLSRAHAWTTSVHDTSAHGAFMEGETTCANSQFARTLLTWLGTPVRRHDTLLLVRDTKITCMYVTTFGEARRPGRIWVRSQWASVSTVSIEGLGRCRSRARPLV